MKETFIEGLHESFRQRMRSYWSMYTGETLYDLARQATSLQALQMETELYSEKGSDHRQNLKNRRGRRGNSPSTVNFVKTGGSTPTTTAMPRSNDSTWCK